MTETVLPGAGRDRVRNELRSIWRTHRVGFVVVIALFGASALAGLAPPRLVGALIDRLTAGAGPAEASAYGAAMLACVLVQAVLVMTAIRAALVLGEDVFTHLRDQFMSDVLRVPMGLVESVGTGELVTRTTQDISSVSETVRRALPESLIAGVTVILTLVAAVLTSPLIAPAYLLAVPVLIVVMRWYMKRAVGVYERLGASYGPLFASLTETANGARTVEALSLAEVRNRSIDDVLARHWLTAVGRIQLRMVVLPWSNLAFAIPVFSSLAWGGWLAIQGHVSIGTVVTVTLYASALVAPLEALIGWTDELQKGLVSFARILGVGEVRERPGGEAVPSSTDVELRDVRFAYRTGHEVLHGVSLRIVPGERLAIVGASGAGKSTLARLLAGIDDPTAGRATIGGVDVREVPLERRRREVLLVTQESHIFAASVFDNVRLARSSASDDEVLRALQATGAADWVDRLPDGWGTTVGSAGHPLTGAQEQQLALARVVLADPHTVILDEATSAIDPTAARDLEAAFAAVMDGRTVIAIAHRLATAYDADRIAVIDAGELAELGTHDELLARGGSYADLWRAWSADGGNS
ncbi:ABC transporter ATP-binding protein [Agromyces laixinhei]|uniref:ABC transporter ATP-binding protein n=1 Tax=Agromyces laixinhei TaxID=2585717 RepID=UPI001116EFB1|nr:ABC transporter ATP-binding protein [Agromyces laixinhei]